MSKTDHIQIISAGAGSGKTFRITQKLEALLKEERVSPSGVIATTFTKLAAAELQERVRQKLIESGQADIANAMGESLIGTVNSVCGELIQRFSFEAGISPELQVMEEIDGKHLFAQALEQAILEEKNTELLEKINAVSRRLGIVDNYQPSWQNEVKEIVSAARANNMSPTQVKAFAKESIDSLFKYFPKATTRNLNKELESNIQAAIENFDSEIDTTKSSKEYFESLSGMLIAIKNNRLSWVDWIRLSKKGPGAKSKTLAEPIQSVASDFAKNPALREDLTFFITTLFDLAAKSMSTFQTLKRKMGLIDFVDQEQILLELLDNPIVKETLSDELDLLMVDEFQDTSPIQLAVFIKLASLAKQVIWVGDIKQSIYGFRGADPELMIAVINHLEKQGNSPEVLDQSWRSRPPLVAYVNEIFKTAFAESISEKQVVLQAARVDEKQFKKEKAVEFWHVAGSNKAKRAYALANQIKTALANNSYTVFDKNKKIHRPAVYGDIAVLCRTNDNLGELAQAFNAFGLPCEYKRSGLLETPEGFLAMACLRRLIDANDTLASAEIIALSHCKKPETWLADRILWLEKDGKSKEWEEETDESLWNLKEQRKRLPILSPKEIMTLALDTTNARKTIIKWCKSEYEAQQRLGNLNLFIEYAQAYQDQCESNNRAATATGLILYLQTLSSSGEDAQALPGGNAIKLVTHHRGKGLEWPIVLVMDMDSPIKNRLWGMSVKESSKGFLWQDPLAGRALQYWPTFFGQQSAGIEIKDTIESSEVGQKAKLQATEETKRLLYVSLTRARDHLIIPLHGKNPGGEWLNSLNANWMLPNGEQLTLPNGEIIPSAIVNVPECEEPPKKEKQNLYWLSSDINFEVEKFPANLPPSSAEPIKGAKIGEVIELGERINFKGAPDMAVLGSCLHAIIAVQIINGEISVERSERIIKDHGLTDCITAQDATEVAERFINYANKNFKPMNWHVEYPIQVFNENGQKSKGFIDLALETEDGWIIIDHKSSPRARSEWEEIALSYSGQMERYEQALLGKGKKVLGSWVHFGVTGGLVKVQN